MHNFLNDKTCDNKKILTVKEFCKEYNIGINKGYQLVKEPDFPKVILGKRILIINSKIDQWFENKISKSLLTGGISICQE